MRNINQKKLQKPKRIVFQPIVALDTHRKTLYGFEALSRPSKMFQQEGSHQELITIDIAALYMSTKKAHDVLISGTPIFVNIRPGTLIWLYKNQRKLTLPSVNLIFEITEQENNRDFQLLKEAVSWIRIHLNCQIAVDDITSGFNRLLYLCDLEPDYLKIDRPLVQQCHQNKRKQTIIKELCSLGKQIGSKVVAEGIETLEESNTLATLGVNLGQGYLFGIPS